MDTHQPAPFASLSQRARNVLAEAGIATVAELARLTRQQALQLPGCGSAMLQEFETLTQLAEVASRGIGHNSQDEAPIDLAFLLDATNIVRSLETQHADRAQRRDELLAGFARFQTVYKDGIKDEESQGKSADFVRQIKAELDRIETLREVAKRPFLEGGRTVDSFFKQKLGAGLIAARAGVLAPMEVFAKAQAKAAQLRQQEEARKQQAEADRLAAEAERSNRPEVLDAAIEAEQRASDTQAAAQAAKPADLSRTHSDLGTVSSLAGVWTFEITDKTKIPLEFLMPNDAKIKAEMASNSDVKKRGAQPIPGVRFYQDQKMRVR